MSLFSKHFLIHRVLLIAITIQLVSCKDVGGSIGVQIPKEDVNTKILQQPLPTSEVPVSETKLILIDSFVFSDNTILQVFKEEVDEYKWL